MEDDEERTTDLQAENARRKAAGKITKSKTNKKSTTNDERTGRVTRSMDKTKSSKSEAARRKSDPGGRGSKRKKT